jgi:aspartate racemase
MNEPRMKTIGLVGGMSWASTALYYRVLNREVMSRLGGLRSARVLLESLDFAEVVAGQQAGDWQALAVLLARSARNLELAGADVVLIGTNTMHKVAGEVQAALSVPLLHIGDVTADAIRAAGCRRVSLLGTRYTMEQPFYIEHLAHRGIAAMVPDADDRGEVHRAIFEELCRGEVRPDTCWRLRRIVRRQLERGADGVVLGCTELSLALPRADLPGVTLFDTTELHARAAVDFALDTRVDAERALERWTPALQRAA